mgnify:CR=1 FL=1
MKNAAQSLMVSARRSAESRALTLPYRVPPVSGPATVSAGGRPSSPGYCILRRIAFHARRIGSQVDRHFFTSLLTAVIGFVLIAAVAVTILEEDKLNLAGFGNSFYWAITTVIGSGDASYVSSPGGFVVGWVLAFFGVAMVAAMTGAIVGFVIDYLLKEGQGMGAAGYTDHIVVCGWNETARDLIEELKGDEFTTKVVVLHDAERNPAGDGVYFVRGDITSTDDLERCGIREASSAIVFPVNRSNEADMRSILAVMAIESIAPQVRTVVEANNPMHVDHFRRHRHHGVPDPRATHGRPQRRHRPERAVGRRAVPGLVPRNALDHEQPVRHVQPESRREPRCDVRPAAAARAQRRPFGEP